MLYSDWKKIRTQNQVNILPLKWIWGGGRMLTWSQKFSLQVQICVYISEQIYVCMSSVESRDKPL